MSDAEIEQLGKGIKELMDKKKREERRDRH